MLTFLGTGAACGVPSFYCGCKACQEAQADPHCVRTRASVLVDGPERILIDASPDLWRQFNRERISGIDRLFLTHGHYDHMGGVGELEFFVRLARKSPLPAYMTAETATQLQNGFGFLCECLDITLMNPGVTLEIGTVKFTALAAQHTPGTLGFLIESSGSRRIAYVPDTGPLPAETAERLRSVDTLILDATFWGRNWMPRDHHSVAEAIQTGRDLRVGQLILTHLSMHYDEPMTSQELETSLSQYGGWTRLAYDGDRLNLDWCDEEERQ